MNIKDKNIVLGVTGSIACYKSAILASLLVQKGANVDVIMTSGAQKFMHPSTFRGITKGNVVTDLFDANSPLGIDHIALAEKDAVVIAPATANTIAKMAHGFSDDPLTCTVLATTGPIVVAPAMETHMYQNFIVQENIQKLKENGMIIVGPEKGYLASGTTGVGRMTEPVDILHHLNIVLGENGDLSRLRVLVTAGGTREKIDAVRVLTNRSSGKMGYAVATAARDRGAKVTLITAANHLEVPMGVEAIHVDTAMEMCEQVKEQVAKNDILVMAAAVADWRAQEARDNKIKKGKQQTWNIEMIRNPDILMEIVNEDIFKVGFAAETEDIIENALQKLVAKKLNLIVANDISGENPTFNSDENEVYIITREKGKKLPLMSKYDVANKILDKIKQMFKKQEAEKMKKYIILFILGCMLFANESKDPFEFSAPKDWRPERISFPLSFAPEIKYNGFEELRFAPGMFNPEKDDYFCYVFFFWIEENISVDEKKVHEILLAYYKGLCKAVAEKRKLQLDLQDIKVSVKKTSEKGAAKTKYLTVVDWYDPFVTGKKLSLHMDIEFFHSQDNNKSILFACVSPNKPTVDDKTWETMYNIRSSFKLKSSVEEQVEDKNQVKA